MNDMRIKLNLNTEMRALIDDLIKLGYTNNNFIDFYVETKSIDMTSSSIFSKLLVISNPTMLTDKRVKEALLEYLV